MKKEGGGECTNAYIYMGTQIVSLYYRTTWWMFMKLLFMKVLMARTCVKARVHYCDHALSVVRCPSVVNFSHFRLLLWNPLTEFNKTWQEARTQDPLPSLCFSGRLEKQDGRPGLWLGETFSTSSLKLLNRIQRNLTGSKISMSITKFVFLGPIQKTRWLSWPLIGWDIFDFSSETAEQNSTIHVKLEKLKRGRSPSLHLGKEGDFARNHSATFIWSINIQIPAQILKMRRYSLLWMA